LKKTAAPVDSSPDGDASGRTEIPNPFGPVSLDQSGGGNSAVYFADPSKENILSAGQSRRLLYHRDQYDIIH
jgi:hypothetical protein